uniref:CSON003949 protein n=1 Tax=Culicoides sonorensis TaxID=179676 RepID=A0A336LDW2_CULSO
MQCLFVIGGIKMNIFGITESLKRFNWPDYLVFFLMLLSCSLIGIYFGWKDHQKHRHLRGKRVRRGSEALDYLVGGREMQVLPVAMSLVASLISGIGLLGTSTEIYLYGTQYCFILIGIVLTGFVLHFLYLPVYHRLRLTSLYEDVIQGVVMIGSLIMVAVKATIQVGGLQVVLNRNFESGRIEMPIWDIDPTIRTSFWTTVIGGWVFHCSINGICQSMIQRYVSLPTLKNARQAVWIFIGGVFVLLGFTMYNGLLLYAVYHDCDPLQTGLAKKKDQLVPLLVMQILGDYPGLSGCFVAGVFSASLSSLSTGLNSITAVILEDFIKPFQKDPLSEKTTAIIMKSTVIIVGLFSTGMVFIVEKLGPVLQLAITFAGVTYGPLLGIFTMGLTMPYINAKNALIGACCGLLSSIWVVYKTQIDIINGELYFPEKPTSVENCSYSFDYSSIKNNNTVPTSPSEKFYHFSYLYYSLIGCCITIVLANVFSQVFGKQKVEDVDFELISPIIRKYFMKNGMNHEASAAKPEASQLLDIGSR